MIIETAAFVALLSSCVPKDSGGNPVADLSQMYRLAVVESGVRDRSGRLAGFDVFALHDNDKKISVRNDSLEDAVASVRARGNVDAGIMQINRSNWARYGLDETSVFDPCRNVAAASLVWADFYAVALRATACGYNTGKVDCSSDAGKKYASRVNAVPAMHVAVSIPGEPPQEAQASDPSVPAWDAYGQARSARNRGRQK